MITIAEFRKRYEYNTETDQIGKGGSAIVYRAWDKKLERHVALKIYSDDVPEKDGLISEIRRAMKFDHPNVVRYYDVYEVEVTPQIILEYGILQLAEEGDLSKCMKKPLTDYQKFEIAKGILEGMRHLHALGMVHRDLKPGNILIVNEQGKMVPKITDFGLSRARLSMMTTVNGNAGTVGYMAPESLSPENYAGYNRYDFTIDIWALGIIFFEWFVGTHPFGANNPKTTARDLFQRIINAEIPPTISLAPEPFQRIIRACLKSKPIERVQTIDELLFMLPAENLPKEALRPYSQGKVYSKVDQPTSPPKIPHVQSRPTEVPPPHKNPGYVPPGPKHQAGAGIPPRKPEIPKGQPYQNAANTAPKGGKTVNEAIYIQCPSCKNESVRGIEKCKICGFILAGPITLNNVKSTRQSMWAFVISMLVFAFGFLIYFSENIDKLGNSPFSPISASTQGVGLLASKGFSDGYLLWISLFALGFGMVSFFIWATQVRRNLRYFGYDKINRGYLLYLIVFMIPVVNLIALRQFLAETWQASDPKFNNWEKPDWENAPHSSLISLWAVVGFLHLGLAILMVVLATVESNVDPVVMDVLYKSFEVLSMVFILFLIITMALINNRQRKKVKAIMQFKPYGTAYAAKKGAQKV